MALKDQRLYYMSRNLISGLSDVTADVYKDGVSTPVATNSPLAELDNTNSPGLYMLEISPASLTTYGGAGTYVAHINSATKNAPATVKFEVTLSDNDDLEVHLLAIEAKIDTIDSEVGAIQSDLTSVKATVEDSNVVLRDGNIGNANLKLLIEQVISAVSSVQNNTRFVGVVPARMIIPSVVATTNTYRLDIRLFDMEGNPEDPDTDQIAVSCKNEAGVDRTNLLDGFTAGPVDAIKVGVGIYRIDCLITDTTAIEQLRFTFDYAETNNGNTVSQSHPRMSETVEEALASGVALQSTLLDVLTDTADIQPKTATILNMVNDVSSGLPALKALIDIVDTVVDSSNAELLSGVHGLAVIKSALDDKASQASVDSVNTALTNDVKGAGFDNATDSLKQVSDRTFYGGTAI